MVLPVFMWDPKFAKDYIVERISQHLYARDTKLPECTPEERWASPDKFAVMKPGGKRAVKLCDSKEEADDYGIQIGGPYSIEPRPGVSRRCIDYCICNSFCSQFKKEHQK
jgi:hypothetical protein